MAQVTIKDIARKLRISASTVSRALRNHPDISPNTRDKVRAMARRFNYQPNLIAQSLQNKRSNTIGVVVPEIKHDFFATAISGIEQVTYDAGYTIMVCQSNEECEREQINTRALVSHRVAGMLISISQNTRKLDHFQALIDQGTPLVFFDRVPDALQAGKVVVEDYKGAYEAVAHLIQSGYTRIAHLAGAQHIAMSYQRLRGYRHALEDHGLSVNSDYVIAGGFNEIDGQQGTKTLLTLNPPPDAIFAVNDPVAIGAFSQLRTRGLKIPQDTALVGFSNNPITALIDPPLTTVDQPAFEIGRTAAKLLLERIETGEDTFLPSTQTLPTRLIVRGST